MTTDLYFASRLKVRRANRHIQELIATLSAFLESKPYEFGLNVQPDTGHQMVSFSAHPFPMEIPLIIGDAIHNQRAALDLLICAVTGDKSAKFPFKGTRDDFDRITEEGAIQKAVAGLWEFIVNVVQPYKAGDGFSLWALNKLDIMDKHQLLIPTLAASKITGISIEAYGGRVRIESATAIVGPGGTVHIAGFGPEADVKIQGKGEVSVEVRFQKGQLFDNEPVIETLTRLSEEVSSTISAVELFVNGKTRGVS